MVLRDFALNISRENAIAKEKIKMQRNDESLMPYEFIPIGSYRRMIIKNNKHTNAVIEKASFVF